MLNTTNYSLKHIFLSISEVVTLYYLSKIKDFTLADSKNEYIWPTELCLEIRQVLPKPLSMVLNLFHKLKIFLMVLENIMYIPTNIIPYLCQNNKQVHITRTIMPTD